MGNGKVMSVGGRCGCEMKSCQFFAVQPISILSPLPSLPATSPLELVFPLLDSFCANKEPRNGMKEH